MTTHRDMELPAALAKKHKPEWRTVLSRATGALVILAGILLAAGLCTASPQPDHPVPSIFEPHSTPADSIVHLSWFVLAITALIFLVVSTLLTYAIVRFRNKAGDAQREPAQVYGSTQIELAWTVIPILIVVVLFLATAQVIHAIQDARKPAAAVEVTAIGHQFWWEFRYPALGIVTANELHIPVSDPAHPTPTFLKLLSADTDHRFWVPQLAGKTDLIPNRTAGKLDSQAGLLYAMLFLWQFPHFMAIAWMYREDYARAGYQVLPLGREKARFMGWQCVLPSLALVSVTLVPMVLRHANPALASGTLLLSLAFLCFAGRLAVLRSNGSARRLLLASVVICPWCSCSKRLHEVDAFSWCTLHGAYAHFRRQNPACWSAGLSLLTSANGVGSLIGSLLLASRGGLSGLGRWAMVGALVCSLNLAALTVQGRQLILANFMPAGIHKRLSDSLRFLCKPCRKYLAAALNLLVDPGNECRPMKKGERLGYAYIYGRPHR